MWRIVLAALLLCSLARAQSAAPANLRESPGASQVSTPIPSRPTLRISIYQRYSGLRRGGEQEIAVLVCMVPGELLYCPDYGTPPRSDITPVEFRLESPAGLKIGYGKPIEAGDKEIFLLKLHAADGFPLGAQPLEGRLTVRIGDQGPGGIWKGNGVLQNINLRIPVVIVERHSVVHEAVSWPTSRNRSRFQQNVADVLRAVPPMTLLWAFCHIDDCDPQAFVPD